MGKHSGDSGEDSGAELETREESDAILNSTNINFCWEQRESERGCGGASGRRFIES
jgi:hypothetical protein